MDIIEVIREHWSWVGIEPHDVVGENDFGNLIIQDIHGKYWRLCPEDVYCEMVAHNKEELDALSTNQDFLHDWYMQELVDKSVQEYGQLESGRKFYLVTPGPLGGAYNVSNIKTAPLIEIISLSGDIGHKIVGLPEGSKVELKVVE